MKDSAKNKSTLKKVMETPFAFNFIWAIIVTIVLISLVLLWLNIYTRHNEAEVVPNVKGMTVGEAEKFFVDNNLRYSVIDSVFSKDVKPGSIVEIIPEAGSKVKEGRIVFVTVNAASAQMAVIPEVWEISVRQADAMLREVGFEKIEIEYVSGDFKDLVVGLEMNGQPLRAGERISISAPLVLKVSSGVRAEEVDTTVTAEDEDAPVEEVKSDEEKWF